MNQSNFFSRSIVLQFSAFIDFWDDLPIPVCVLLENMDLVVSSRNSQHIPDLAPAHFPARHLERKLLESPFIFLRVLFPEDLNFLVFWTSGNSVEHQADIVAPGHVPDPVSVLPQLLQDLVGSILEDPHFNLAIIPSSHEPFRRQHKLLLIYLSRNMLLA